MIGFSKSEFFDFFEADSNCKKRVFKKRVFLFLKKRSFLIRNRPRPEKKRPFLKKPKNRDFGDFEPRFSSKKVAKSAESKNHLFFFEKKKIKTQKNDKK